MTAETEEAVVVFDLIELLFEGKTQNLEVGVTRPETLMKVINDGDASSYENDGDGAAWFLFSKDIQYFFFRAIGSKSDSPANESVFSSLKIVHSGWDNRPIGYQDREIYCEPYSGETEWRFGKLNWADIHDLTNAFRAFGKANMMPQDIVGGTEKDILLVWTHGTADLSCEYRLKGIKVRDEDDRVLVDYDYYLHAVRFNNFGPP